MICRDCLIHLRSPFSAILSCPIQYWNVAESSVPRSFRSSMELPWPEISSTIEHHNRDSIKQEIGLLDIRGYNRKATPALDIGHLAQSGLECFLVNRERIGLGPIRTIDEFAIEIS